MKKNDFLEGALFATIAIFITKILGVLYVIPFYKMIGTDGGALYGYAYQIYNLFLTLSSAGIPLAISKITSEYLVLGENDKKEYLFRLARQLLLAFSLLSFLILFIFAPQIAYLILGDIDGVNSIESVTTVLRFVSLAILIVPNLSVTRGYLQGHKYIKTAAFSQVVEQFIRIAVILVGSYLTLYVFKGTITNAVSIAVSGATLGAIVTLAYLITQKNKYIKDESAITITKDEKKDVLKKIFKYSIPFIIISIANHLYNATDMILLIRGLDLVGISGDKIETISSIFTTWGSKLTSIVTAASTGLVMSLIPSVVSSYTQKKHDDVNKNFNKALQLLLFVVLPLSIFASIFAREIWSIFYDEAEFGAIIMKLYFIIAFFDGTFTVMCSTLNAMNRFKFVYIVVAVGLGLNAVLDVPLILLCNKVGIYPYYGALFATLISYFISTVLTLIYLNKKFNFSYLETLKTLPRLVLSLIILIVLASLYEKIIPNNANLIETFVFVGICGIICLVIYYFINKKMIDGIIKFKRGGKKNGRE